MKLGRVFIATRRWTDNERVLTSGRDSAIKTYKTLAGARRSAGENGRVLILDLDQLDEAVKGEDLHLQYEQAEAAMLRWAERVEELQRQMESTCGGEDPRQSPLFATRTG